MGLTGVASAVFGPDDGPSTGSGSLSGFVAAIGVSGPTSRLEGRTEDLGTLLISHTEALSELLQHGTRQRSRLSPTSPGRSPERETA